MTVSVLPMGRNGVPLLAALLALIALTTPLRAVQPDEVLADPALEARARALSENLRCVVCQNQSIDDSNAPLARDLRILLRERLSAGDSDEEAVDYLVARYGTFVLFSPPVQGNTLLLWFGPALLLIIALAFCTVAVRRRAAAGNEPAEALATAERRQLEALLKNGPMS